jgi:hypothetical protein
MSYYARSLHAMPQQALHPQYRLAVLFKGTTKVTGNNLYITLHSVINIFYKPLKFTDRIHIHFRKSVFVPWSLKLSRSLTNCNYN